MKLEIQWNLTNIARNFRYKHNLYLNELRRRLREDML